MVYNLGETNSIANQFLYELREVSIQQDPVRFRRNMERLGEIMAMEISKKLDFKGVDFKTPLAPHHTSLLQAYPILVTVLRAGLPFFQGFSNYFDKSPCGFIGAYRKEGGEEISINLDYLATPSLQNCDLLLIDPMLATGKSFVKSINELTRNGIPRHIHVASLVSTPEGISFIQNAVQIPITIWTFSIDEKLNDLYYIVPGLGDAGDLSFGEKI
jgi:uracil phosphoribosyltransferase